MTTMRTAATTAISGFICFNLMADENENKCFVQRGDKTFIVNNTPQHTVSEPIHNSFVYIAGEYVEPPYIVSVSNLAVCINGRIVNDYASDVFIPSPRPVIPQERPVLPNEISKETDNNDERILSYVQNTRLYLQDKLNKEELMDEMLRVYQSLPNVKNVKRDEKDTVCLNVTYHNDETKNTQILTRFSRPPAYNLDNVGKAVDREYENWVQSLQDGIFVKFFHEGGGSRSSGKLYDGDGGALSFVTLAKKAEQGDEKAREELINAFKLGTSVPDFHPDWIKRLANNGNLEARATVILERRRP